jgi:hypothetical protein
MLRRLSAVFVTTGPEPIMEPETDRVMHACSYGLMMTIMWAFMGRFHGIRDAFIWFSLMSTFMYSFEKVRAGFRTIRPGAGAH